MTPQIVRHGLFRLKAGRDVVLSWWGTNQGVLTCEDRMKAGCGPAWDKVQAAVKAIWALGGPDWEQSVKNSSPGGDTASAFAAYNVLRNVNADITTFNAGNIDSAAMLIFCAGKHRYSFPSPARFLIHGNAMTLGTGMPMDYGFLNAQLQQIKSLNQMVVQVLAATTKKPEAELQNVVNGQTILSPDEAKQWGIVDEIRSNFMEPGAVFVTVNAPPTEEAKKPFEYTTIRPEIKSSKP